MAANKAPQLHRSVMSEPRVNAVPRYNFGQPFDDRFLFNLIGGEKEESKPNNYYNWKPSSTFAEQPSAVVRSKKSKNKEREQNFSGQADAQGAAMMSNGPSRRRTPATYPRTQHVSSLLDREELENLRQQLTYSDIEDQSTDSQALGSVSLANRVNNARLGDDSASIDSFTRRPPSILDTIFVDEKPDRNKIVARLMQIRDYVKQANAMMSTLQNSIDSPEKDDQAGKLGRLQEHLGEQERGYLALLERMLAEEISLAGSMSGVESSVTSNDLNGLEAAVNGRSSQNSGNSGESFATSVAESASINLDARSDISEATTEGTFTARTRPKIESHLGNHSCASDNDISDSEFDDIRSVSSQASGSFGLDTQELHEQYSSMLQKYQDGDEENMNTAMERINLSRNEGQDDSRSSQMSSNSTSSLPEGQQTKQNVSEQIATLEGLRKQHDLLRKMLKQQEELRTLQNRQTALMTLQSQIESRLTNSEQEKAEETLSVTSTQATTTTATSVTEDTAPVTTTVGRFATGVPLTAEDLQERRRTLMHMLAEQRETRSGEIQQARALDWMEQEEVGPPLISSEHEELRDKLEALQQKKRQMDELLIQLHALHPDMPNIGGDTSSIASTTSNANEYSGLMVPCQAVAPDETSDENEATLTNGPDSLRKLHDVRERLTELRDLVQQYQDTSHVLDDQGEDSQRLKQMQQLGLGANFEDPVLMSNLRRLERGEPMGRPVQMMPNHMSFGGDGAYVQVGSGQTTSTATETETETETESNHSSILAAWGDDPEIKEKVRKLQEAKHKLHQLQSLVAMVQQTPEVATALPDDLAELAAGLADYSETNNEDEDEDDEDDEEDEEEEEEGDETVEESGSELAMAGATGDHRMMIREEQVPADFARETREAYYEAKMHQQRRELQGLMAERHRLLGVQEQLKELNQNLPPVRKQPAKPGLKSVNIIPPTMRDASTNVKSVATPSREEVYSEMRRNRVLQDELRQKKTELSDLLHIVKLNRERLREGSDAEYSLQTDLAGYDNDLFRELLLDAGRMSLRSADITAAATWGGSTQVSDDEGLEDGYPSDGILQVEEEEEEEQSIVTSDTYTIESGPNPSKRRKAQPYPGVKRVTMEDDGDTSSMDAARHGIRYPKHINSAQDRQSHLRQQNIRSAEELVSDSYDDPSLQDPAVQALQGHIQQLQRQLSNSMGMCQSLITDQQSMSNLLSGSLNAGRGGMQSAASSSGPNPFVPPGESPLDDLVQNYNLRMQHQQLMLNLNSAYTQLYQQQGQIQTLRTHLGERTSEASFDVGAGMANSNTNNNAPSMYRNQPRPWGVAGYPGQSPPFGRSPGMGPEAMPQYRPPAYNPGMSFNMNPTFPPGFAQPSPGNYQSSYTKPSPGNYQPSYANPYAPNNLNEGGSGQRDTYNPYARQPPQQRYGDAASYHVPPNTAQASNDDDEFETAYLNGVTSGKQMKMMGGYTLDSGIGDINDLLAREPVESREELTVPPLDITSLLKRTDQQRRLRDELGSQRSNTSSNRGAGKHPMPSSAAQARAQLSSQSTNPSARLAKLLGPKMGTGLSSSISGTAFLDTASITSTVSMSSLPGDMSDRGAKSKGKGRQQQQQRQQQQHQQTQQDTDRSIKSQTSELESDAGSEFSLFEALRESIYSEVASLISQNETRPHFLIELFRELQMLNSDYLRQRALYALQDLVSKYLTDDNNTNASASEAATLPSERSMPAWMNFAGSEQTPSESFITSDEEEIKARLFGASLQKPHESSYALLEDDQYDYIENVDSASTLSTPPSLGRGEFGFANEDLGDTVIHLDKALKRMREYERMKAEAEIASGMSSIENSKDRAAMSASDMTSNSSAQDMGSESSFSDLPYPRIDTRQLDLQIKGIMQEVIPYLKEHMDDVCSPQLLAYIRRLVLGLARQKDESREFVRFFNRQLGSILEDSLAKFSGRKMRECGEDLLVDISEILFNELAFFRLMQDLDTAGNKLKQQSAKRDEEEDDDEDDDDEDDDEDEEEQTETGTETGTAQDQATGEGESSSDESSSDEEDTVQQRQPQQGRQQQQGGAGNGVMEDELESAMAVASKFEEEELGNTRDDMLATQVDISDKEEDSEPQGVDHLQIELSMSESKGVTYIGSGEEEDGSDDLGEAVEETITSIGAANADEEIDSVDDTTMSTEVPVESDASQKENVSSQESKDPVSSQESKDPVSRQDSLEKDPVPALAPESEEILEATVGENNNEEITVDDLPAKLDVISTNSLENQLLKEQTNTDGVQGVLETMVEGEAQLAGDPMALRAPEGAPVVENGIIGGGNPGEIGSE